jgi:hypothetical protein
MVMTALVHLAAPNAIEARIELGHWLAECGTPYCRNALRLEYGAGFLCGDCGLAYDVLWPAPADARQIVALLGYRPDWVNRNWLPSETVLDLLMENLIHGVKHTTSPELGAAASTFWLDTSANLHVLDEPLVLDAAQPLAIGA